MDLGLLALAVSESSFRKKKKLEKKTSKVKRFAGKFYFAVYISIIFMKYLVCIPVRF